MVCSPKSKSKARLDALRQKETLRKQKISAIATVLGAATVILSGNRDKQPMHTSILTGQRWLEELLNGHPTRFYNQLGMKKLVFCRLLLELRVKSGLHDTKHVKAEEQLAIFLYLCRTGASSRLLMERFQRSPDTISRQGLTS
jgi:hypothetical protein